MTGFIIEPKYIAKGLAYASSFIPLPTNPVVKSYMHYLLENVDQGCHAGICTEYKTTFKSLSNAKYEVAKYVGAIGVAVTGSVVVYVSNVYSSNECKEQDIMCYEPSTGIVVGIYGLAGVAIGAATAVAGGALALNSFMDMHHKLPAMASMFDGIE
jgi:hypothetical protein